MSEKRKFNMPNYSRILNDTSGSDPSSPVLDALAKHDEQEARKAGRLEKAESEVAEIAIRLAESEKRSEEYKKASFIDTLTGCFNRNYYEYYKDNEVDIAREDRRLGLVVLDIDNFKAINDTKGHDFGDEELRRLAAYLKGAFRKGDAVIRMGGDEFAVLVHLTGVISVDQDPSILHSYVESTFNQELTEKFEDAPVKISFGVAVVNKNTHHTLTDVYKEADAKMYASRRQENKGKKQKP